ncbi:alpha-1,3-mannosyltransferase ALG2 [Spathaspora passalidarum NRRL Y-27907]|uniref:Alpha-1,3/1,6-mannosyltransferase ALG2 n=1 Tax=Spathaspora passalidarum (strain NRRL Y-27907 / 11-Y1) TaxID=619300 RepID=G3AU92_SPAPN|nr:alpha-1,3-mannosyltransferase ALG2 [Spathaspora passalidarum NRRL Y-27907]EGW30469.1 alpha-1,3-mannosyltransferase ALG2 [Spathaspora passalidarum NRRL Y-27907]
MASSSSSPPPPPRRTNKRIAFIHPDLGIGGAERLVVDAAMGLQSLNNDIQIFTSHCDPTHCFEEVSSGQLAVTVYGDFLPTNLLKRFHILFAILRQLYLVFKLVVTGEIGQYDYFIIDQLSMCVPLVSWLSRDDCRVLFYCHFPDQLLAKRTSKVKSLYRVPFDMVEEWSTGCSDVIVVNSNFTKSIFYQTFKTLGHIKPGVIYPCVDTVEEHNQASDDEVQSFFKDCNYYLSINRFERAKNIELAIRAFHKSRKLITGKSKVRLVIAGGWDARVAENVQYLQELTGLCDSLKLTNFTIRGKLIVMPPSTDVLFLPSIRSNLKVSLIKRAQMLLYTPEREHFGIVPVESMLYRTPVLAINFGGPLETVVNYDGSNLEEATGYIEESNYEKWAKVMVKYWNEPQEVKTKLGDNGHDRVLANFSRDQTSIEFMNNLTLANEHDKRFKVITWESWGRISAVFVFVIAVVIYGYIHV